MERPSSVLVAMDKFRGTMGAGFANEVAATELYCSGYFDVATSMIADGGEGTVDAVIAGNSGWAPSSVRSVDCWGRRITANIASKGSVVLTEAASVVGLRLRPGSSGTPPRLTTTALGLHLDRLYNKGAKRIILALGGTATLDGGLGAVVALNWALPGELVVAADVMIPYLDAINFARQKYTPEGSLSQLADVLDATGRLIATVTGVEVTEEKSGGAGGGLSGALAAIGGQVRSGFEVFDELTSFSSLVGNADAVLTGEGKLDFSTYLGKAPGRVESLALDHRKPVAIICGANGEDGERVNGENRRVWALTNYGGSSRDSCAQAAVALRKAVRAASKWLKAASRHADSHCSEGTNDR
jgi:glycerate kinase